MSVDTLAEPVEVATSGSLEHFVCCRDDDTALCGTDVSAEPWTTGPRDCVVCCSFAGTGKCPISGDPCPVDDDDDDNDVVIA